MSGKLHISQAPHICTPKTTRDIMLDVLVALVPTSVAGIVIFGLRALAVIAVCVATAVLSEYLFCLATKRKQTIGDLSAAVTGLLLALNLPANIPIWQCVIGAAFSIVCVKCFFGGLGQNFANPAITGRIFMLVAFTSVSKAANPTVIDTFTSATPLVGLDDGVAPSLIDLFMGIKGGAIGEVCIVAILLGAIYLLINRVILPHAPLAFILTTFLLSLALEGGDFKLALAWCLSGGLMLGAFFMATDYSTTPITPIGKIVFGVGAGLITVLIRFFGSGYPEGVSFAILFMNILTPYIDRLTERKPFGGKAI